MSLTYFDDINVYFHMKNHYKMLKNVKSVVDTSLPQSLQKGPIAMSSLDKRVKRVTNEHLRKIYNTSPHQGRTRKRGSMVKKHNCLSSEAKSEAYLGAEDLSLRPSTRRNPNATPKVHLPARSNSMDTFPKSENMFKFNQKKRVYMASTRSDISEIQRAIPHLDLQQDVAQTVNEQETIPSGKGSHLSNENNNVASPFPLPQVQCISAIDNSAEEHEYLLFLLRITEDIIANDFYSNDDIKKIFKMHVQLNKDRLNMRKMHFHIASLCKELDIDCKEYRTPETFNQSDSPRKFLNSPNGHRNLLNNDAFKSCQDCSVIRTSSLYSMHSAREEYCALDNRLSGLDGLGDGSSIGPSFLRLLEKFSLGRVTECTEPVASTSTMNSPKPNVSNNVKTEETHSLQEEADKESPVDFETFVAELESKEMVVKDLSQAVIVENINDNTDILNSEFLKISDEGNESNKELSDKEINSYNVSEKYEYEFEKSSGSNELGDESEINKRISLEENILQNETESSNIVLKELPELEAKLIKSSRIPVLIKEKKNLTEYPTDINSGETHYITNDSPIAEVLMESDKEPLNIDHVYIESPPKKLSKTSNDEQNNCKVASSVAPTKEPESVEKASKNTSLINQNSQKSLLTVILQGSIKDDDYVMVKGPVYIYKPLLESEPKLIILTDNEKNQKSRRNSLDSQHTNRTFTVDHSHVQEQSKLDQDIQYDTSLHSLEHNRSMENILDFTKTPYSQFMDMKLLQSDYDLTPERDGSDNKYHHLFVDATTSVSGVNITESLLLNDDYLTENNVDVRPLGKSQSKIESREATANNIDSYRTFEHKMYENNYVIHRKLTSSTSMPKLKLPSGQLTNYTRLNDGSRSENVLRNCSSDLSNFDLPSQDSSLRKDKAKFRTHLLSTIHRDKPTDDYPRYTAYFVDKQV